MDWMKTDGWECGGHLGVRRQSEARAATPPWRRGCRVRQRVRLPEIPSEGGVALSLPAALQGSPVLPRAPFTMNARLHNADLPPALAAGSALPQGALLTRILTNRFTGDSTVSCAVTNMICPPTLLSDMNPVPLETAPPVLCTILLQLMRSPLVCKM